MRIADLKEKLNDVRRRKQELESKLESINREIGEITRRRERLNMLMNSISEYDMRIAEKEKIVRSIRLDVEGILRRLS